MALKLGSLFFDLFARTDKLDNAERRVNRSAGRMSRSFARVGTAIATALTFEAARRMQVLAENALLLDVRLKAVSDTTQQFTRNQRELMRVANQAGQAFGDVITLFERIKLASKDLGATNDQVLKLTESLNKLGIIGGSSSVEINNALRQLSQAFAGGIVRAEEYNSIIENTPAIARAIADGLDIGVGAMRNMVIEGRLLSEDVFNAILSQQDEINKRFEQIPRTSAMAWQAVQNQAQQALKIISEEIDSTKGISGAFDRFANNIIPFTNDLIFAFKKAGLSWKLVISEMETAWNLLVEKLTFGVNVLKGGFRDIINMAKGVDPAEFIGPSMPAELDPFSAEGHRLRMENIKNQHEARASALNAEFELLRKGQRVSDEPFGPPLPPGEGGKLETIKILDEAAFQDLMARFGDETEIILAAHRKRQEAINAIVGLGAEERRELEKRSAMLLNRDLAQITMMRIASVKSSIDALLGLLNEGNAKQSALGRVALGISKGLAIAEAIIAMQQNIANASKVGFPQNIPMIAGAVTQGIGIITTLRGVSTTPGRANGGPAVGGFATPVTEKGMPEIFENARGKFIIPAAGEGGVVTPMNASGAGGIKVTLINNADPVDITANMVSRDEMRVELERTQRDTVNQIDSSLATAKGSTFDSLRRSVDVNRRLT